MSDEAQDGAYGAEGIAPLELVWGEGFLSPGGADEVGRIVSGALVSGADVLDVGCGTGGAAFVLVADHDARSVVGVDVAQHVVDVATRSAADRGVADRVRFQRIEPGRLPFADESFDVVFSKDAIIHVPDKAAVFAELHRVLRPGGRLCVGDWLRGAGSELDGAVADFVTSAGGEDEFFLQTLAELGESVRAAGFVDIELVDRCEWYHVQAQQELAALVGPLREPFIERLGEDSYHANVEFWNVLVEVTRQGVLRPGHARALKPRV
jgi:SAM-dependent methyltransferase